MATSNITSAVDIAFLDRADIKVHVGNPQGRAVYQILASCLNELMDKRVIEPSVKGNNIANFIAMGRSGVV
jgi:hypothetical protein